MTVGRASLTALIAIMLVTTGCAVGNFLAGAPASHSITPARALLERRCSGCHMAPEPASMSAAAWQAALERMKHQMRLQASEWDSLAAMRVVDARH